MFSSVFIFLYYLQSYLLELKEYLDILNFLNKIIIKGVKSTMEKLNSVLVTGYAKAPQGTSMYEIYRHAGIVLEVELETHTIIDVEFTMVAELTKKFFKKL